MAEFTATVYQNEFLPDGGTDVNAIVTVTCAGAGTAGQTGGGAAGEIIIVDTSGSMGPETMEAAKYAAQAALAEIVDGTWFAVIAGSEPRDAGLPAGASGPGDGPDGLRRPARPPARRSTRFRGSGGTAISTWLDLAGTVFASVPEVTQRHAILLTDGENRERRRAASTPPSTGPPATSSATAAVPAPTGRSRRSAGSPRPCSAPSTSSRSRPRCRPSSRR